MRWRTDRQVDGGVSDSNRRVDQTVDKSLLTNNYRASSSSLSLPPRAAAAATTVAVAVDDNAGISDGRNSSGPPRATRRDTAANVLILNLPSSSFSAIHHYATLARPSTCPVLPL